MKILYHHRIGSKDGQYVHIEELVMALRHGGHEVLVVGPADFDAQEFGGESGLVARLKRRIPGMVYEWLEFAYNGIDYLRLRKAIRCFRPDVIYERYNLYLLSGVVARKRFRIPLLLEVNAPLYDERAKFGGLSLPRLAHWSEGTAWRSADHVFAVTRVLADHVLAAGVDDSFVTVTPNGINLQRFSLSAERAPAKRQLGLENHLVLGFVGFAREWHGLDAVVDLLAAYKDQIKLHFLMVGDGPAREALERQAHNAGVAAQMTVTGIVDRTHVANYINAFDIALQPSVVAYASPLKLFEYLAGGSAIVAPNTANIQEILTHGHDALLFNLDKPDAFKEAVDQLVNDGKLRKQLGQMARKTLNDKQLTWEHNATRVTDVAVKLGCNNNAAASSVEAP